MARPRRTYTAEFKVEAVKLVTEQGYSVAEAARSLGIHETLLRSWKQALHDKGDQAFPGQGKLPAVEEELHESRRFVRGRADVACGHDAGEEARIVRHAHRLDEVHAEQPLQDLRYGWQHRRSGECIDRDFAQALSGHAVVERVEFQRSEDLVMQHLPQWLAGHVLDDGTEHESAGERVNSDA